MNPLEPASLPKSQALTMCSPTARQTTYAVQGGGLAKVGPESL
jgi:hypothetical protein